MSLVTHSTYYTIKPPDALADLVEYYWVFEGSATRENPFIHRCIASTGAEWIFHYRGSFDQLIGDSKAGNSFRTGVDGLSSRYTRYVAESPFGIFGVHLYPYALQSLFGVPAVGLVNQSLSVHSFAGEAFTNLEQDMFFAHDNHRRYGIMSSWLNARLGRLETPKIAYIVKRVLNAGGDIDITSLAEQCFLSVRQFQRVFKEHTGFSPKSFARLARFNAVLSETRKNDSSLTDMAYRFGYYDQSHFIHDFKTYTGYTPNTFAKGNAAELIAL